MITLGLFLIVINAFLLYVVSWVVPAFTIDTFGWAILGALIIGLVSLFTNGLIGGRQAKLKVRRQPPPPRRDNGDDGPVIDV